MILHRDRGWGGSVGGREAGNGAGRIKTVLASGRLELPTNIKRQPALTAGARPAAISHAPRLATAATPANEALVLIRFPVRASALARGGPTATGQRASRCAAHEHGRPPGRLRRPRAQGPRSSPPPHPCRPSLRNFRGPLDSDWALREFKIGLVPGLACYCSIFGTLIYSTTRGKESAPLPLFGNGRCISRTTIIAGRAPGVAGGNLQKEPSNKPASATRSLCGTQFRQKRPAPASCSRVCSALLLRCRGRRQRRVSDSSQEAKRGRLTAAPTARPHDRLRLPSAAFRSLHGQRARASAQRAS